MRSKIPTTPATVVITWCIIAVLSGAVYWLVTYSTTPKTLTLLLLIAPFIVWAVMVRVLALAQRRVNRKIGDALSRMAEAAEGKRKYQRLNFFTQTIFSNDTSAYFESLHKRNAYYQNHPEDRRVPFANLLMWAISFFLLFVVQVFIVLTGKTGEGLNIYDYCLGIIWIVPIVAGFLGKTMQHRNIQALQSSRFDTFVFTHREMLGILLVCWILIPFIIGQVFHLTETFRITSLF